MAIPFDYSVLTNPEQVLYPSQTLNPNASAAKRLAEQEAARQRRQRQEEAAKALAERKQRTVGDTPLEAAKAYSDYSREHSHPPIVSPERAAAYAAYSKYLDQLKVKGQYNDLVKRHSLPLPYATSIPDMENRFADVGKYGQNIPEKFMESFDDNLQLKQREGWTGTPWITSQYQAAPDDPYWNYIGAPSPFRPSEKLGGSPSEFFQRIKQGVKRGLSQ